MSGYERDTQRRNKSRKDPDLPQPSQTNNNITGIQQRKLDRKKSKERKMDFTTKDFDCSAVNTAMNELLNVQNKKQFDIADVDNIDVRLENDDWNIDSIFPLNNDFLSDFNNLPDLNMETNWTDAYDYMSSPTTSTGTTESETDHDMFGLKSNTNNMLSPPQQLISSSQSDDSGLSSDHIDFDMNFDQLGTEFLKQPLLSTQIIPELVDEKPIQITPANEVRANPVPIVVTSANRIPCKITQSAPVITTTPRPQVKNTRIIGIKQEDIAPKPKVQFVKKLPTNIIQFNGDASQFVNKTIRNENGVISPIVINKTTGSISGVRKVIQVKKGPNQKSIILPFSLKNGTDIRSIKIIKPSSLTKSPKILMAASNLLQEYKQNELKQNTIYVNNQIKFEPKYEIDSEPSDNESYKYDEMIIKDEDDDDDDNDSINDDSESSHHDHQSEYPKLLLSIEEKRLLAKEGIALPAHYPLTKHEERELKRIRRKIRNKISAQDSRKRKKEYVDGLEERVRKCTDENQTLLKRIKLLQSQNQNLINQMKKMQSMLTRGGNKSVQPATCLMVLLMSMALIAAPNMKFNKGSSELEAITQLMNEESQLQSRRTLLFDSREKFNDAISDEEMGTEFGMSEHNYAGSATLTETDIKIDELINDFDVDDTNWTQKIMETKRNGYMTMAMISNDDNSMDVDRYDGMVTAQTAKSPRNLSYSPSDKAYTMNGVPNIISLSAEIDAKNV